MNSYFGMLQHYDAHRLTGRIIRQLPSKWYRWMCITRRGHRCRMVSVPWPGKFGASNFSYGATKFSCGASKFLNGATAWMNSRENCTE